MSIEGRITELSAKHSRLETEIKEEMKRAARDDLRVVDLKRRKLRIKEELRSLGAA